jgi:hypothetical protein
MFPFIWRRPDAFRALSQDREESQPLCIDSRSSARKVASAQRARPYFPKNSQESNCGVQNASRPILYALAVFTCFAVGAGRAQTSLANCGKGLVLFSVAASEASRLPPYLKLIANDGWTLEVQPVEAAFAREGEYAGALRRGIDAAGQRLLRDPD